MSASTVPNAPFDAQVTRGPRQKVRVGVIGCADVAYRRMLPAMAAEPTIEFVAVASRTPEKSARFAARFGCEPVLGYEALLRRKDLDAVYLPLPAALHLPWTMRALTAGLHVLVEKPFAVSLAEAEQAVALADRLGLLVMESFMFLHHAQHAAVRKLVDEGAIGELRVFTCDAGIPPRPADDIRYQRALGGGALLDVGVYPIRAAQLLLGDELDVLGSSLRMDREREVDLGGSALLCTPGGACARLSFGIEHGYRSTYSLWGSAGRIEIHRAFTPPSQHPPVVRLERQDHVEELTLAPDDQFARIARAFARAVIEGAGFARHREEILRQAALVDAVRAQARRLDVG
jgi:NDP-hexose-3-ketoreductase